MHSKEASSAGLDVAFENQARKRLIGFDEEKAIAAILYVAKRLETSDKLNIAKVLYFADRYHLNNYFRFILGDRYARMPKGPVPSSTYDLLKSGVEGHFAVKNKDIIPLAEPDMDEFSRSDIIALNHSLDFCKGKSAQELSDISHDEVYNRNAKHFIDVSDFVENTKNKNNLKEALLM